MTARTQYLLVKHMMRLEVSVCAASTCILCYACHYIYVRSKASKVAMRLEDMSLERVTGVTLLAYILLIGVSWALHAVLQSRRGERGM